VGERAVVPKDVVCVRIDPSILVIPEHAFFLRCKLETIELHNNLREICNDAFSRCTALREVHLSDGVERIGYQAFYRCNFTKFRSPPLVTTFPYSMLGKCPRLFSLEMPEIIIRVEVNAFLHCYSLRNVALASNTVVAQSAFDGCVDLLLIFGTVEAIVSALKIRFAELPVHSKMYYKSYYDQMTAEEILNTIIIGENGELDPSGLQQDRLGMTPLHILACSTIQCLELYQLIVDKYPANLIVEDAWGATPLLYALWGDAPSEIIQFLVNSYQSHYPDHEFDWNDMLLTLGRRDAPRTGIQNLLDVQQTLTPGYNINWDQILGELALHKVCDEPQASSVTFCFLTRSSIATRINAIGVKHFQDAMADDWTGAEYKFNRHVWRTETLAKLEYYESEYRNLKEMTSLLELVLWKARISSVDRDMAMGGCNKKMKMDPSEFRLQCRVSCGADHVIENVLPYLLPPNYDSSYDDEDGNDVHHRWLRRVLSVPAWTVHTFLSRWRQL